jgi:pimeloyl-ACP methyl ester carboxylesterase
VNVTRVDWSDAESVIEYLVDYSRALAGHQRAFDDTAVRELARREVMRARNFAAAQNHEAIPNEEPADESLSSITAPTLVVHGTDDPMFPLQHGEALADEIPNARLLMLERAGHGVDRADWDIIVRAIIDHTARAL